jgi:hypothetical protein
LPNDKKEIILEAWQGQWKVLMEGNGERALLLVVYHL